jgi:hypothetical protein
MPELRRLSADDCLDLVVARPDLEQPIGNVRVDNLAAVVLADAGLLPGHADHAVACK